MSDDPRVTKSLASEKAADFAPQGSDEQMLCRLLRETFDYFLHEEKAPFGLIPDSSRSDSPISIAVVGMALSCYVVGVDKELLSRANAVERTLKILRFFAGSRQGPGPDAAGYQGFYYHFLDAKTGKRAWGSELSTIDTGFLIAGMMASAAYFNGPAAGEAEIRQLAEELYRRVNWQWALNGAATLSHGWKPRSGFLKYRWDSGYSEAMLLYVLALGSPTFPIEPEGYKAWTDTFELKSFYGVDYLYAGPLFIHQFSQQWLDLRGLNDDCNRKVGFDYFENSRRATVIHRDYAVANPLGFAGYGAKCWGLTASNGPGPATMKVNGVKRVFYDYLARGAPLGPDDGTVSPWGVVASLPFSPDLVLDTVRHSIEHLKLKHQRLFGLDASFNPTFPDKSHNEHGWASSVRFGLNQGPIVMMIGNYQGQVIWNIMKQLPWIRTGLLRAGFRGGWLSSAPEGSG